MNSISLGSIHLTSVPARRFHPCLQVKPHHIHRRCCNGLRLYPVSLPYPFTKRKRTSLRATESNIDSTIPLDEGATSVVYFEEFVEKDWSVLDSDQPNSKEEFNRNIERIISAGKIEDASRVLVSTGSEEFVDCLIDSSPCNFVLVVHDSLLILAGLKEKYDNIKCWQGEIIYIPEKWAPLDVVFLYFLPALPFKLDQILGSLAKKSSPGARLVISHPHGREALEQQRQEYPLVVVSDLPDKTTLQRVAAAHSFDLAEFVDEPGLFLAVLILS
ncbi:hypothetical protein L6164_009479 [Bauhinia variegata]|uniref:Uncharacterized protein n=1 Tax=Bauhinia variegata TaxID=167791 RepID=A0ACB9PJV5_BAUVA|nr:hypothetical protein L6164_009479 [Bauhinia variegata]